MISIRFAIDTDSMRITNTGYEDQRKEICKQLSFCFLFLRFILVDVVYLSLRLETRLTSSSYN